MKFPGTHLPGRHLPFQITELLNDYLIRESDKNKMPQMRWTFQLFGKYYNPHDPECMNNPQHILEQTYAHAQWDQQTVDLYFNEQINHLWWGQHHFPEMRIITRDAFEHIVGTANKILSEKPVAHSLVTEFEYYVKLYQIYFRWEENGKSEDFHELCKKEGLKTERQIWPCEIPGRKSRPAACFLYLKHLIVMPGPESNYNGYSQTRIERRVPNTSDVCTYTFLPYKYYLSIAFCRGSLSYAIDFM